MHDGPTRFKTRFSRISLPGALRRSQPPRHPLPPLPPLPPGSTTKPLLPFISTLPSVAHPVPTISAPLSPTYSQHATPGIFSPGILSPGPETPYHIDVDEYVYGDGGSSPAPLLPPLAVRNLDVEADGEGEGEVVEASHLRATLSRARMVHTPTRSTPSPVLIDERQRSVRPLPVPPHRSAPHDHKHSHTHAHTHVHTHTDPAFKSPNSTKTSPSPRKGPPAPIDLVPVHAAYPSRSIRPSEESHRSRAPANVVVNIAIPRHHATHTYDTHNTHPAPAAAPYPPFARADDGWAEDPLPVPRHRTLGEGYRYPSWESSHRNHASASAGSQGAGQGQLKWAASRVGDLGTDVLLDDVFLTPPPRPRPGPPPQVRVATLPQPYSPPGLSFGDKVGATAKKARRASRQVVDAARAALPLPSALKGTNSHGVKVKTVRFPSAVADEHGWEMRYVAPHGAAPLPVPSWTMGAVDAKRVTSKIGEARAKKTKDKNHKKRMLCLVILIIVVIGLAVALGLTLRPGGALNSGTKNSGSGSASGSTSDSSEGVGLGTTGTSPSVNATQLERCLFDFQSAANPDTCHACASTLTAAPNDFAASAKVNASGVGEALQFCALLDILAATADPRELASMEWGTSLSPCGGAGAGTGNVTAAWGGISCDQRGRVTSLALTRGIPTHVPATIGNLVALENLEVVGNTTLPAGPLPLAQLAGLKNLTSLIVTNTALTGPISELNVSALPLQNFAIANSSTLGNVSPNLRLHNLTSYVFSGQGVEVIDLGVLPVNLKVLDMSFNRLSGNMITFASFMGLTSLNLASNQLTNVSTWLPGTLTYLDLSNNTALTGPMPSEWCASKTTTTCKLSDTRITATIVNGTRTAACARCGV